MCFGLTPLNSAQAQITPDGTLGAEGSVVTPNQTIKGITSDRIDGGAVRGGNLFHSFQEFNIESGRGAYFSNPGGVENILTRVTGSNVSNILGTLGVLGNANLFFVNPNGIIFGQNASLDIRGSFTATTADEIRLGEDGLFSATNPQSSNLLTVQPGALFKNALRNQQATINNQGHLTVDEGKNLTLFGANVINTGGLTAPGGTVQLTGAENLIVRGNIETGTLLLETQNLTIGENDNSTIDNNTLEGLSGNTNLIFQAANDIAIHPLSDNSLNLANGSGNITFTADNDGDDIGNFQMNIADTIKTNGRSIDIKGVNLNVGNIDTSSELGGGNITLTATQGNISTIDLNSYSYSFSGTAGNGGVISLHAGGDISTQSLLSYSRSSSGTVGNGGDISLFAQGDISTYDELDSRSYSFSGTASGTVGNGGDISLVSAQGNISTFALLYTSSDSTPAGDISLEAAKDIRVGRTISNSLNSSGGNIKLISGNSISIEGFVNSRTNTCGEINLCNGNSPTGGDIYLKSPLIEADNHSVLVDIFDLGKGGNLIIEADVLNLFGGDDANFGTRTLGFGTGGNLIVNAKEINLTNGGALQSITQGIGDGGDIHLTTNKLIIQDDRDNNNRIFPTGITTLSHLNISSIISNKIAANIEFLSNFEFTNDDVKTGKGGNIIINASEYIEIIGNSPQATSVRLNLETVQSFFNVSAGISTGTLATGEAGQLTINTKQLITRDRTGVFTGSIAPKFIPDILPNLIFLDVNKRFNQLDDSIKFALSSCDITPDSIISNISSQLSNFSDAGNGGNLEVNADEIQLQGTGALVTLTISSGNAGNLITKAKQISLQDGSIIAVSALGTGNAGNLNITTDQLIINNGSTVGAGTIDKGFGGNINIAASELLEVIGTSFDGKVSSSIFAVADNISTGNAGNITLNTPNLTIREGARIEAQTKGTGAAGNIFINNANFIDISGVNTFGINSGLLSSSENPNSGNGGTIIINQSHPQGILNLSDGGFLSVLTRSGNNGGEIGINVNNLNIESGGQIISTAATGSNGNAGNISIIANNINIAGQNTPQTQNNPLNPNQGINSGFFAFTEGTGNAGNILIDAHNLTLADASEISASTTAEGKAGDITLNTPTLTLANGGKIFATTTGSGDGGTITVNATNTANIGIGVQDFAPVLSVETSGAGKAGDIFINTPTLTLSDTARITATATETATNTQGGGSITLNASKMDLAGVVGIFAETQGQAPAGTLQLNPYQNQPDLDITLFPNSTISASTTASGKGGDLNLTAPENINIAGQGKLAVESTGTGDAGNIQITTKNLNITDGVQISASTFNTGKGGNINLKANNFTATNGAQFLTTTFGNAQAGNINLIVKDNINLDGTNTGLFANTEIGSTGKSGSITIDPQTFIISNGAGIGVNSQGSGEGGDISLQAGLLSLNNQAFISAETANNQGGNINLAINDLLLLRNNSNISATAGTAQAGGNGGNITINAPFIVAFPNENSDITANAFEGNGGNINITTNALFGIEFQTQQTPRSDITASSQFGVDGNVEINRPDVDPTQGLIELPTNIVDASNQIDNSCQPGTAASQSSFVATGRGGLPLSPTQPLQDTSTLSQWVKPRTNLQDSAQLENQPQTVNTNSPVSAPAIVQASGWVVDANGKIYLVAQASPVTPPSPGQMPTSCTVP